MSNSMGAGWNTAPAKAYSLTVLNQNSLFQHFALFQTPPQLAGPSVNPLTLAWLLGAAAPGSPDNPSQSRFDWTLDYSAMTGYVQAEGTATNPRRFTAQTSTNVGLSDNNLLPATYMGRYPQGVPAFGAEPKTGTAGVVTVQADGTIPTASQQSSIHAALSVGLALDNRPTVAMQLLPNLVYQFTPHPKYYIIAGSFQQGQIIDVEAATAAFEIQYDGVTDRTVVFTPENTFTLAE